MQINRLHKRRIHSFLSRGQTLVEYALIVAFISVVAIGTLMAMGGQVSNTYSTVNTQLINAEDGGSATSARH
jgi:Flp pilus assembly pilin Flp